MQEKTTKRIGWVYGLLEKIKQDPSKYDPWAFKHWNCVFRGLQGVHIEEREGIVEKTREYLD
jgi:hypothetical protein